MYNLKFYDRFNNEITAWTRKSKDVSHLSLIAKLKTSHTKAYAIIEDESFNRYGWYENGEETK